MGSSFRPTTPMIQATKFDDVFLGLLLVFPLLQNVQDWCFFLWHITPRCRAHKETQNMGERFFLVPVLNVITKQPAMPAGRVQWGFLPFSAEDSIVATLEALP